MMSTNITGRDSYIIAQALYVAARALRSQERPEWSNADDMEAISEALFPGDFDWWHAKYRMEEGLRMGLKLPAGGLMMDGESVAAWISAGTSDRERSKDAAADDEFDRNMAEMEKDYQETVREEAQAGEIDVTKPTRRSDTSPIVSGVGARSLSAIMRGIE